MRKYLIALLLASTAAYASDDEGGRGSVAATRETRCLKEAYVAAKRDFQGEISALREQVGSYAAVLKEAMQSDTQGDADLAARKGALEPRFNFEQRQELRSGVLGLTKSLHSVIAQFTKLNSNSFLRALEAQEQSRVRAALVQQENAQQEALEFHTRALGYIEQLGDEYGIAVEDEQGIMEGILRARSAEEDTVGSLASIERLLSTELSSREPNFVEARVLLNFLKRGHDEKMSAQAMPAVRNVTELEGYIAAQREIESILDRNVASEAQRLQGIFFPQQKREEPVAVAAAVASTTREETLKSVPPAKKTGSDEDSADGTEGGLF